MSKPRFFVGRPVKFAVDIAGPDARHIKDVLRLGVGDTIEVVDPGGTISDIEITGISSNEVSGRVVASHRAQEELPQIFLFQALPKAGKMDTIIRQVTEIGAAGVSPVLTERVVVKVDSEKASKKTERWQKIAAEAAKQSHRTLIPSVSGVLSWKEALEELKRFDEVIVFWEEERGTLAYEVLDPAARTIAVVIGPEGGLSDKEALDLKGLGAKIVTLGESILRVETAAPVAVALILYDVRRMKKSGR
ncbi:MAG: RsmE family RNA methyltransferase [Candidatus Aquicultor sp.]